MSTPSMKFALAVTALTLLAGFGGAVGAAGPAQAGSPPTITVQDVGSHDGAGVAADGTQGDFKQAIQGSMRGPLMDAVPQI